MKEMPITASDLAEATNVAIAKGEFSTRQGHIPYGATARMSPDVQQAHDLIGCLGELKASQCFGQPFNTSENGIGEIDCRIFEARARDIRTGRDLAYRPIDKMRLPYVLVWIDLPAKKATIVGWLVGWEAHQRAMAAKQKAGYDVLWNATRRVWFIPPPYHSVASLEDWILVGHPQHWAPEGYRA